MVLSLCPTPSSSGLSSFTYSALGHISAPRREPRGPPSAHQGGSEQNPGCSCSGPESPQTWEERGAPPEHSTACEGALSRGPHSALFLSGSSAAQDCGHMHLRPSPSPGNDRAEDFKKLNQPCKQKETLTNQRGNTLTAEGTFHSLYNCAYCPGSLPRSNWSSFLSPSSRTASWLY